jgi:hypothetical protein
MGGKIMGGNITGAFPGKRACVAPPKSDDVDSRICARICGCLRRVVHGGEIFIFVLICELRVALPASSVIKLSRSSFPARGDA